MNPYLTPHTQKSRKTTDVIQKGKHLELSAENKEYPSKGNPLTLLVWRFLKNLNTELLYDPTIPLLGIYPDKIIIQKDTCTLMFTEALFTAAKTGKQPKCPSTDEWKKKKWYIYTTEQYSATKTRNNAICSSMGEHRDYHNK